MLPYVLKFNLDACSDKYKKILLTLNKQHLKADNFIDWVESLAKNIAIPQKLSNIGVKKTDLEHYNNYYENLIKNIQNKSNYYVEFWK